MDEERPKASPLQALRVVLSAFFGVRRMDDHRRVRVTPAQAVIAAVVAAAIFVLSLITVVRIVTR